jgi:hypothetical protein
MRIGSQHGPTAAMPRGLALRSESGAAPFGVFAQIAIYLL